MGGGIAQHDVVQTSLVDIRDGEQLEQSHSKSQGSFSSQSGLSSGAVSVWGCCLSNPRSTGDFLSSSARPTTAPTALRGF